MGHLFIFFLSNLKPLAEVQLSVTQSKSHTAMRTTSFNVKLHAKYQLNFKSEETGCLRKNCIILKVKGINKCEIAFHKQTFINEFPCQ